MVEFNVKDRANCCGSGTRCISQHQHSWTLVLGSGYSIVEYCPWCGYKLPKIEPTVTTGRHGGKPRIYKKKTNPETNESIYIFDGHEMVCKYCMGDGRASADRPCSYCK